jgi:hypothetical protein
MLVSRFDAFLDVGWHVFTWLMVSWVAADFCVGK